MKKLLLASAALAAQIASPALAADWPVIAPTYQVAPEAPPPAIYSGGPAATWAAILEAPGDDLVTPTTIQW
jgi:acetyl esterase/lipase